MESFSGACHCQNIRYKLYWPASAPKPQARACQCSFCQKHQGVYTSHPDAQLDISLEDSHQVHRYTFGTKTAEFHICQQCGVVPFVTSEIQGKTYAVVNVHTLESLKVPIQESKPSDFDSESAEQRLSRRQQSWIAQVRFL